MALRRRGQPPALRGDAPLRQQRLLPCGCLRYGGVRPPSAGPWCGPRGGALPPGKSGGLPRPRAEASAEAPCGSPFRPGAKAYAVAEPPAWAELRALAPRLRAWALRPEELRPDGLGC